MRTPSASGRAFPFVLAALVVLCALAVYAPVADYPFVAIDDFEYVVENPQVRGGLTPEGARWAFSTFYMANWHPLTWLSHMLDVSLFGMHAGRHHLVNVAFHLANTILLFVFFRAMTGQTGRSAFVTVLFALHPLHVESVAWVAERKDVLSTFFLLLTLLAYHRYALRPTLSRYLAVSLLLSLGLLAKPMLVTVPFLLLLLDWWPLGRFGKGGPDPAALRSPCPPFPLRRLLLEKAPLVLLAVASSAVTYIAQSRVGAVSSLETVPLGSRAGNALVSYGLYLGKILWPSRLAVFYPHPGDSLPGWQVLVAALTVAGLSGYALWRARRLPFLAVGWFWFVGTLVPVIGLVQVGMQGMAERYTYVPLIGVSVIVAWGAPEVVRGRRGRKALAVISVLGVAFLSFLTWRQVGYYSSNEKLFLRTLEVTERNHFIHTNLGALFSAKGDLGLAEKHYRLAWGIRPEGAVENYNLGDLFVKLKRHDEAIPYLRRALKARPDYPEAHYYLGMLLARKGSAREGLYHLREALRYNPNDPVLQSYYRMVLDRLQR
jgi:hypothetical protein